MTDPTLFMVSMRSGLVKLECWRGVASASLAIFYGIAGVLHLIFPGPFVSIVPAWAPDEAADVWLTGIAELLGALGLLLPLLPALCRARTRRRPALAVVLPSAAPCTSAGQLFGGPCSPA
ncbi:hypothetical protein [Ensifer canadensis]